MSGTYNLTIEQKATFSLVATWKDSTGTAVNLTGYTAAMDITDNAGTLLVDVGTTGTIALGGSAGTITITIPKATTATFAPGAYRYDLFLTSSGNVATRLLKGTVMVEAAVTS